MFPAFRSLTYFTFSSAYRLLTREHATHAYRREPLTLPARLSLTPHRREPRASAPRMRTVSRA